MATPEQFDLKPVTQKFSIDAKNEEILKSVTIEDNNEVTKAFMILSGDRYLYSESAKDGSYKKFLSNFLD